MPPRFSILLATVVTRADLFAKLHAHILKQTQDKPVEIVVACDNKEISIGRKRQNLLESAQGAYVAFVDDDDWVADDYVDRIIAALATGPDCVGFEIKCSMNGAPRTAIASMRYPRWENNLDGYDYVRGVYHKTPLRRDMALEVGFPDLRYGEDKIYADGVMRLVRTEVFVPGQLYHYRYSSAEPFYKKYGMVVPRGPAPRSAPRKMDYKGRVVG